MSRLIIKHPTREEINKWGILAHVEEIERNRILSLPFGQFKPAIKLLERDVDLIKFPRKKKSIVTEYYASKIKPEPNKEINHAESLQDE